MTAAALTSVAPGSARAWLLAARPATLTASVVPVVVGTAVAIALGGFRLGPMLAALLGAIFLQIGTNFANDVFDFEKGTDAGDRLGPPRAAQMGLLSPSDLRVGMIVSFALATLAGVYLTAVAGVAIVIIGVLSIASGIAYTGGPAPLGYLGLGDVFVLVFFGLVAVCGTAFVQLGEVPPLAVVASVPVGALATAILVVNNVRDRVSDTRSGKRTLVVRFGRTFGVVEYALLVAFAYATPLVLAFGLGRSGWTLLPLTTLPLAARLVRVMIVETSGPVLNRCLASTAKLLLSFGVLLSIGLCL